MFSLLTMKKLFALFFAGFVATAAFAEEAPDVLVQRVTEEVLEIIRHDKDIQNGSTNSQPSSRPCWCVPIPMH